MDNEKLMRILPANYKYVVDCVRGINGNTSLGFEAVLQVNCSTSDDCKQWVLDFSNTSKCTWRVRNTYPKGRTGITFRKDYVCQHSKYHKSNKKLTKTKDTGCAARFNINGHFVA
jgi:hypothetical protein